MKKALLTNHYLYYLLLKSAYPSTRFQGVRRQVPKREKEWCLMFHDALLIRDVCYDKRFISI